jgi:hypothetical protein
VPPLRTKLHKNDGRSGTGIVNFMRSIVELSRAFVALYLWSNMASR